MSDTEDDELDEFEGLDDEEMREALLRRLQTKDALKAIRTSVAVCDDKKAPAAARVQAASNILRAGGFFARRDPDEGRNKEPHEMTGEELRKFGAQAQRDLRDLLAKVEKKTGVFD
ncbi:hypothetical protein JQ581_00025 [Bradyrhizobium liaoningense]|uniref:hypothetical protein n=1 Tax=Bradyrhizobium liaoningense TaxID=43992 RepID=UPI001BAD95B0|nr:hypothetical protein [Bradyrhizobium liaoningense]MBR0735297.1 hypothetical protein [Bradyrhizobium liaoningense]